MVRVYVDEFLAEFLKIDDRAAHCKTVKARTLGLSAALTCM